MEFDVSPQEAATELLARQAGRTSLMGFTKYTKPGYMCDPFHELVASKLDNIIDGSCKRLMIFAPPRHGKSELSTRRFPAYYLGRRNTHTVISASYNGDFATTFGRDVRDIVNTPQYRTLFPGSVIRSDIRAMDEWKLESGGLYYAVGVCTSTTGKGSNLFLIDDPIKDRRDADSPALRNDQWEWYREVVYTRLEEDAAIVLTLTRWHHDDIAGRLIDMMNDGRGIPWEIIKLPALPIVKYTGDGQNKQPILNENGSVPGDVLGRRPGDPLAPSRFSAAALKDRQDVLGPRSWAALYQQEPILDDGGMFRSNWFEIIDTLPARRTRVRAWDLGATIDGDWTVGVLMSKDSDGVFYIEDVIRFRGSPMAVEQRIYQTAASDGKGVAINLPQDPGQAGKAQAQNFLRRLAGWKVKAVRPTGSKVTRAEPFASQCEAGNVKLLRRQWNQLFLDELATFPLGQNDDQIDAAADAFNALIGPKRPAIRDW